ncbi:DUF5989 family protein [Engelhardtia mirabilis]|uniref:Uncharacterized protein n=1 Tax=Engelhardtia mirabilis TaxID=2528011 RepID=A0A518BKH1_9BACT|nr:hypothetical protein Pla133_25630 [Planctomycetes bacterium Pla133]QDV01806.1 hypothetical protein Pla86_25620 [Planctomycetes bacterium Pla86]
MKAFFRALGTRSSTAVELLVGVWNSEFWWLVPLVLVLLSVSIIFVFLQAAPLVAPFVYTVF